MHLRYSHPFAPVSAGLSGCRFSSKRPGLPCSFYSATKLQECRDAWCALALCTILSAGIGTWLASAVGESYLSMMRMAASCHVSIVGSAVSVFFPFLVSFLLIKHSKPWLVFGICALRVMSCCAVRWALACAFGSAGWLVSLLFQFPDICLMPLLFFAAARKLCGSRSWRITAFGICFTIVIGMLYYSLIVPFLADLLEFYKTMEGYAIHVRLDWRI